MFYQNTRNFQAAKTFQLCQTSEINFHRKWLRCTFPEIGRRAFSPFGDEPYVLRNHSPQHMVKVKLIFGEMGL